MKIVKLLLLLTFGIWADFKLDVPNDVNVSQLENIVNNGWNDSNITLNTWIISNVERVMPEILEKVKKPVLKVESTDDNLFPGPKLLLAKDDVLLIVAYTKYLERHNKLEEAMKNYEDKIKLERKQFMGVSSKIKLFASGLLVKIKSLLGIEIRDFGYVSEYMARQLVCVATPKINQIYLDYLQHIEKNIKLIKKLEIINETN